MLEFLLSLTLFGHFVWFAVIITSWVFGLFWSEYIKQGWAAAIFTIILIAMFHFDGVYPIFNYFSWSALGLYLGAGFIYSLVKTFLFARKEQTNFLKQEAKIAKRKVEFPKDSLGYGFYAYEKKSIVGHVFRWWFLWPVSLISWIFTDLVKDVYDFVWRYLKGFYFKIVKFAESTVKIDDADGQD